MGKNNSCCVRPCDNDKCYPDKIKKISRVVTNESRQQNGHIYVPTILEMVSLVQGTQTLLYC